MHREDRFVLSRRPYAVDLSSLAVTDLAESYVRATVRAVWFRRRRRVTVACIGELWDFQDSPPADAREFLRRHDDGRYGGDTLGRWDGTGYWGAEEPEVAAAHLAVLRPMLERYPEVPPGFDGWWRF